ncbi:MAG: response regulator [Proteobacteria bacterium]|nr:response regulator [Pseudomonadota bacterium]
MAGLSQWNQAAVEAVGVDAEETYGQRLWDIVPYFGRYVDEIEEILRTRKPKTFHRQLLIGGENKYYDITLFPHNEIQAVLLDMVMPRMSGKEAFIKMKEFDPELKVLLASGFKQDERVEDVLELGIKDFIQKPYALEKLAKKIKEIV